MSKNISELSGRKGLKKNLFEEIGTLAKETGTPSEEALSKLATEFIIGDANVYGTATFYDFLRPDNKGKKVYICNGSACLAAGTQEHVKNEVHKHFDAAEVGTMCCLGRCHENSAFHYDGKNYSGYAISKLAEIKNSKKALGDKYHVEAVGKAVLTGPLPGVNEYYQLLGKILSAPSGNLLNEIKESGLRGRGGAGFPIGMKLESCRNTPGETKFIVCNADEGDPGAYSDRYILEVQPHRLLLGMMIAGFVTGAEYGVVYIRAEYPESIKICQSAIDEIRAAGYLGKNILGSTFNFDFKIIAAQGAYICGEETALLSSIEGQRPEVRVRPPYPTQQGLFNKPTVVNNVETLAVLPFIAEHGGKAYAATGRGRSTGTKLVCLDSSFTRPGIYEVEMGTPLNFVIDNLGKGFKRKVKALHIGGPLGGLVPVSKFKDLTVDFESFSQNGFLLGHASVIGIPEEFPMIDYLEHLFEFCAHESCGKCFPCRLGSTRGFELVRKARISSYKIDEELFQDLIDTMETASLCALGGGLPLPIKNALVYFKEELSPYFTK
ncbi:MAG: NAD(P)H-dependent oxidoreductase subunit E [Bacteroidetes bacterium]|nr:NAD(P)H-dependent oxidoreductase subunit E [Bacteroidota bacterium]